MVGTLAGLAVLGAAFGAPSIARMEADLRWMVEDVGPRPTGGPGEAQVAAGVQQRLADAGWSAVSVGTPGNLVACRGEPSRLFLAHTDSVPASPGAIDNGAAVAALLELARDTHATDLCLGFPTGEEVGLVGSRVMAEAAVRREGPFTNGLPQLVVAMDLVGHGDLAIMGLGPPWGDARLGWLAEALDPLPRVPFAYRVYSQLLPRGERSDHGPFVVRGVPGMLLLGQGPGEVFPRYHQASDRTWEPQALVATVTALDQLAQAPLPPAEGPAAPWSDGERASPDIGRSGAIVGGWVVPGWLTWMLIVGALGSGLWDLRKRENLRELPRQLGTGLLAAMCGATLMAAVTGLGLFASAEAEVTAGAVMGAPQTGWWTAAPIATVLGLAGFLGARRVLGPRGSAPVAGVLTTGLALGLGPLFALPFAVGALLSRVHPWLACATALVLLRPDGLRQLTFHGLMPPAAWGAVLLFALPAVGRSKRTPPPKARA